VRVLYDDDMEMPDPPLLEQVLFVRVLYDDDMEMPDPPLLEQVLFLRVILEEQPTNIPTEPLL